MSYYHPDPPPVLPIELREAYAIFEQSSPRRQQQHNLFPLLSNTQHDPSNSDVRTAVSDWLATSLTFEKPPEPPGAEHPADGQNRRGEEYWRQVSRSLDLRIKALSEESKAPIHHPRAGAEYAKPGGVGGTRGHQPQNKGARPAAKAAAAGQLNTLGDTVLPSLQKTMGSPRQREWERENSIETNMSEVREKLEKFKREQEKQEQLQAQTLEKEDLAVKAKAEQRAADATVMHTKERERKEYVESRARDIHENLLLCKPFDMDAARREFSEKEVQDIKKMVRELGFGKG